MSLFKIINDHVERYIAKQACDDTPANRIVILQKLKAEIEQTEDLSPSDRFKTISAIDSEICVQRVRTHVTQLDLF